MWEHQKMQITSIPYFFQCFKNSNFSRVPEHTELIDNVEGKIALNLPLLLRCGKGQGVQI